VLYGGAMDPHPTTPPADGPSEERALAAARASAHKRTEPGTPPRRRLEAAHAQEAILAAAESLLVASGPEALRLTEIASRAGVSHPNVLYHFGSVAELQRQLAQRIAVRLAGEVARIFSGDEGLAKPIDRAIAETFEAFDERGYARLLAWLALSQNEPTWDALGANLDVLRAAIVAHPALRGEANVERRRRVVSVIEARDRRSARLRPNRPHPRNASRTRPAPPERRALSQRAPNRGQHAPRNNRNGGMNHVFGSVNGLKRVPSSASIGSG
jgi:AcrR family transcriptional regulator